MSDPITTSYTVYALSSLKRNYIYVGLTGNLEARINRHNSGLERTTKPYTPFELIFTEEVTIRSPGKGKVLEVRFTSRSSYNETGCDQQPFLYSGQPNLDHRLDYENSQAENFQRHFLTIVKNPNPTSPVVLRRI